MELKNNMRSQVLIDALPYIQKYYGKTIVVKYGGNAMISDHLYDAVMSDIVMMSLVGINVVVVHGGGPDISNLLDKTGKESKFVNGLRYTDEETMDIVQMVLCGKVNKDIVTHINQTGGRAVGLCGMDDNLMQAKKLDKGDGFDYGLVGEIVEVNPEVIESQFVVGAIPVIAPVAQGMDGNKCYNVNADMAACVIAAEMKVRKLVFLSDVPGVLRDPQDESSLITTIQIGDIPHMAEEGVISGGMIPKLNSAADAIRAGVGKVHMIDGRLRHSLLLEIFTDHGIGTQIVP